MRTFVVLLALSLTNTSYGSPPNPFQAGNTMQLSPVPGASQSREDATDPPIDWEAQYLKGLALGKKGTMVGLIGLTGAVGAIAMLERDQDRDLSAGIGMSGILLMWAGSGVSAWGTSVQRRALVRAGAVPSGCLGCVAAWGTAIYPPLFPVSYIISSVQRGSNKRIYGNIEGLQGSDLSVRLSPMPTSSGPGLGLTGTF